MEKGLNGEAKGKLNAANLGKWLESVKVLPMHGGKPNKSEIAKLAKLTDRQPFKNNPECKRLLAEAMEKKGLAAESRADEERAKLERRIRTLEVRADKEMAENFELRRQLKRLRHIEKIIESGGRIIP